jgi:hypothetical protein
MCNIQYIYSLPIFLTKREFWESAKAQLACGLHVIYNGPTDQNEYGPIKFIVNNLYQI